MEQKNKTEEQLNKTISSFSDQLIEARKSEDKHNLPQYKAILDNIPDMAWLKDANNRYVCVNESFARACGLKPEEVFGKTDLDIWPQDLAEKYMTDDTEVMRSKKQIRFEDPLADKEGKIRWIESVKTPFYNDKGHVIGTCGVARDITEQKHLETKLRESRSELGIRVKVRTAELTRSNEELRKEIKERQRIEEDLRATHQQFLDIIEFLPDATFVIDTKKRVIAWNKAIEEMTGVLKKDILGKANYAYAVPFYGKPVPILVDLVMERNTGIEQRYDFIKEKGKTIYAEIYIPTLYGGRGAYVWAIASPLMDTNGKVVGVVESIRDITERKKTEKEREELNRAVIKSNLKLKELSLLDTQTGLYNHRYLIHIIEAELYRARRYAHALAVIMLDIDYFKSINDVYGHEFGDLILKQFAKQLKQLVRKYDIVIRFGGEEFVVLSPGIDRQQALVLAQRLLDALNLYNFGDKQHTVKLKLSFAVVSYPDDRVAKGIDLINLADQILDLTKERGGNIVSTSLDMKRMKQPVTAVKNGEINITHLKGKLTKLTKKANQSLVEAIFAFAKTIELKDHYTGEHVENTVHYATKIARGFGLPNEEVELVKQAAMLHDLGKIGISEKILLKKGKLTNKEFEIIKKHPQIGADILRPIQFLHGLIPFIYYHHERWDGKGYPVGLKGEDICVGARIIAIADVYQALTSDRPYRKAYSKEEALKIIKKGAGTQFDPKIVAVFLKILEEEKRSRRR